MMTRRDNIGRFNMIFSTIEDLVPQDARVRLYDKAIDWTFIYPLVEKLYSSSGKPSIDPIILFKIIFLNYIEGIHSIRKTCERCKTDVGYRWFLRMNFDEEIPDHSTISQNLKRKFLKTELFREIFFHILHEAYDNGFIDATNVFGDSTHVKASANKKKYSDNIVRKTEDIYYEDLKKDINYDRKEHGKKEFDFDDKDDDNDNPNSSNTDSCDDELIKSSDENQIIDSVEDKQGNTKKVILYDQETGVIVETSPKKKFKHIKTSTVDPDAGFYHKGEHEKQFAYSASALCDSHGFILDTYITSGNKHDSITFKNLYDNFKKNFLFSENNLVCLDAGYNSPSVIKSVIDSGKDILLPYCRPKTKEGFFKKYEYVYDEYNDAYICPNNEFLHYSTTNKDGYREYKSNPSKCVNCPFRSKCTQSKNNVKVVTKHVWDDYVEQAADIRYKIGNKEIYKQRKETIERCFGDGKENFGLRFTRYRGIKRVTSSLLLLFSCMNLKKLALWKAKKEIAMA